MALMNCLLLFIITIISHWVIVNAQSTVTDYNIPALEDVNDLNKAMHR